MGCIHTPNPYSNPCGDCRSSELERQRDTAIERAKRAEQDLEAEREHRLRETARADRERTLRLASEERFHAQGAILDEAIAHAQALEVGLAEAESYGQANGFREGLRSLGGGASDVYERAIATWGPRAQLGMVQEECAELIASIHRRHRGRCTDEDVAEEAADVWIMLEQLVRILGRELVDQALERKLARLCARVEAKGTEERP